jgi:hypothetical protein
MYQRQPKKRLLSRILALTLALSAPMVVSAQTSKEAELEGRIQQLEQQLNELKALVAAQKPAAPAPAPAAVPGAPPPPPPICHHDHPRCCGYQIQWAALCAIRICTPAPAASWRTAVRTDLYLPSGTPVGGADEAAFTRTRSFALRLGIDKVSDAGDKVSARIEFDSSAARSATAGHQYLRRHHPACLRHLEPVDGGSDLVELARHGCAHDSVDCGPD